MITAPGPGCGLPGRRAPGCRPEPTRRSVDLISSSRLELETEFLFSIPDPTAPPGDRQERRPARQTDEGNIWLQNRSDGDKGAAA